MSLSVTPLRIAVAAVCALALAALLAIRPAPRPQPHATTAPVGWVRDATRPERHGPPVRGAMAALQWWSTQRAYPGDDLPDGRLQAAWRQAKALPRAVAKDGSGPPPWRALGPRNIAGRILCLAFNPRNPRTLWAGSASGGLWVSRTAGVGPDAWQRVPTGLPVLGVGAIAVSPADTGVITIGTGEIYSYSATGGGIAVRLTRGSYGIGILQSRDGGRTWRQVLSWPPEQGHGVQVLRIDPSDPGVMWAGTTDGTYRSDDGGRTWRRVHDVPMVTDLLVHAGNPDIVLEACGNLGSPRRGLYRTVDGGTTWSAVPFPTGVPADFLGKIQLGGCAGTPDVMLASIGNGGLGEERTWLIRSEDGGASWSLVSDRDFSRWQGWYSHDVAVDPRDPQRVYAAGIDIWLSTDGGATLVKKSAWYKGYEGLVEPGAPEGPADYSHADHHDIVFWPGRPDTIYFATDGGVFHSLDGGNTFRSCNGGLQTTQFYPGFSCSRLDSNLALGGMQDNSTAIYTGGDAWLRVVGGDGAWTGIDWAGDDTLFASAQYLDIFKSTDRGATWDRLFDPDEELPGTVGFIAPFVLGLRGTSQNVYAGTSYLLKSTDGGRHFEIANFGLEFDGNPALAMAVAPSWEEVIYLTTAPVVTRAGVFVSTSAGWRFIEITGTLPDRYPVGLAVDPTDSRTAYVAFSGFGTGHVFRTRDRGETWEDITADLPDAPVNAVFVDPERTDHIYVGTDLGVFVSTDDGRSWQDYGEGLPEAVVCMDLSWSPQDRMLRLSTYGNGVYQRPLLRDTVPETPPSAAVVLRQNAPNPFNPGTRIAFSLARAGRVRLAVLDLRGRVVRTLVDGELPAGDGEATWDGTDAAGRPVPSGTYLCRIEALGETRSVKLALVR